MMRYGASNKLYRTCLLATKLSHTSSQVSPHTVTTLLSSVNPEFQGHNVSNCKNSFLSRRVYMSSVSLGSLAAKEQEGHQKGIEFQLLRAVEDQHGGVVVNIDETMDTLVFASMLDVSLARWKEQRKKGVWIKLPIENSNLVAAAVKAGFRYHHAEPDYMMLVNWISNAPNTIPPNASHRVGIGAFVMNSNGELLVVQESNGRFSGKGIWKLPTGAVNEGEDICTAAIREVKEETGIDTEFVEVLAFRQSHQTFFQKSDLFFACLLQPYSFKIQRQASEIAAAQWMPIEDYVAQPFVRENELFDLLTKIWLSKVDEKYTGFSTILAKTSKSKKSYLYFNKKDASCLLSPNSIKDQS
ncbi:nudix hydrolase 2-like [Arachis stenosperma]|uniref:nudix hydrolase 2-like n=1 Tax=Arachis stenosperma TaxID=217475 RepID=UPI0025ABC13D|nr:nudix hydrolase 2-like [Arachis stenosperma]